LGIALPVFFYCAKEFFINAYKSIIQKHLNIDAPIALAIIITFLRSVFEIFTNAGAGYLDSMSGIVFFMLIGRALQNKTQKTLKFNRDYKSYFPVAVTIIESGKELTKQIENIKIDDVLLLHHQEIIPVDCILSKGKAEIDYSFITGENTSQLVNVGELIYSGGKVISSKIEVITAKTFSQNSFTQLWNNSIFKNKTESSSFVNILSKYFSLALFGIAFITFIYWFYVNPSIALNAFTAVLIVACPCSLLLTSSFTFGYIIEVFNNKGLFVKGAQTIEEMSNSTHVVFDKTGTLTEANSSNIIYFGAELSPEELSIVISCMKQSMHPLSKVIAEKFSNKYRILNIINIKEIKGEGIEAWVDDKHIKIGNKEFTKAITNVNELASRVYISIDNNIKGCFIIENKIKDNVQDLIHELKDYSLSLLSGDNESSKGQMEKIFPNSSELNFNQSPINKLDYILKLQNNGKKVIMVGDGLNDAGALKQSNCGISIVQNYFSFSPACDGILEAKNLYRFSSFIKSSVAAKKLIKLTFVFSIFYNIIGLSFAVSGNLQPAIAAILMPASSISIILISYFGTKAIEKKYF
jgi:Cu+-exporting ATPase